MDEKKYVIPVCETKIQKEEPNKVTKIKINLTTMKEEEIKEEENEK